MKEGDDMVWCDMMWYGEARNDIIWYDIERHDMIWEGIIWYDMIWEGMIWYDMIREGMVGCQCDSHSSYRYNYWHVSAIRNTSD